MMKQVIHRPTLAPLLVWQGIRILPGLNAITGDEGSGKTRLLTELARSAADTVWLDLRLPDQDQATPLQVWGSMQARWPHWNPTLQTELTKALALHEHADKRLSMLSAGSRRKVGLVGLLACGATITCLDQPYAALDMPSTAVLREFLGDVANHPAKAWVVADYEQDARLRWASQTSLAFSDQERQENGTESTISQQP